MLLINKVLMQQQTHHPHHVVVFDLDQTIIPSVGVLLGTSKRSEFERERLGAIVNSYKQHGYGVGINTARLFLSGLTKKYLRALGIDVGTLPSGAVQTGAITSNQKVKALHKIRAAYGDVPPERVIFFDNKYSHVHRARASQFNAMQVKSKEAFPVMYL